MMNASWSTASQLAALSVVAYMCAACPTSLAETAPSAVNRSPDAASRQGSGVGQGVRVDRACNRLFDGRGEKIRLRGAGGEAGASATRDCRVDKVQREPVEADVQPKAVEPSFAAPAISAGPAQVDQTSSRARGAGIPIAPRISAGQLSATLVTGGTAMFLLHSSLWTYLLILGLPFWQHVDLLPIVDAATADGSATGDPERDADEERAVSRVLDTRSASGDGAGEGRS
jgi:hypothetical protein